MTTDNVLAFSPATVAAVIAEAQALNLKGATAITVALRNQLAEMKASGKVPDNRTQTYWLAARVVRHGMSEPVEGVADVEGLAACNGIAADLICAYFDYDRAEAPADLVESQLKSARVNLSRKGEAHLQVMVEQGQSWLDLYAFPTEAMAQNCAEKLPSGKVF